MAPEAGYLWHEDRTVELARAYEERLREARRRNVRKTYENWDQVERIRPGGDDSSDDGGSDEDDEMPDDASEQSQGSRRTSAVHSTSRNGGRQAPSAQVS